MTHPFSVLAFTQPASECLAGGRSPAVWLRLLARTAKVADSVARSCSGLGFLNYASPFLQKDPLFGSGIEVLTKHVYAAEREPQLSSTRTGSSSHPLSGIGVLTKHAYASEQEPQLYGARAGSSADRRFGTEVLTKEGQAPEGQAQLYATRRSRLTGPPLGMSASVRRDRSRPAGVDQRRSRQQVVRCLEQPSNASRELLGRLAGVEHAADSRQGKFRTTFADRGRGGPSKHRGIDLRGRDDTKKRDSLDGVGTAVDAGKSLARRLVRRVAYHFGLLQPSQQLSVESGSAVFSDQWSAPLGGLRRLPKCWSNFIPTSSAKAPPVPKMTA